MVTCAACGSEIPIGKEVVLRGKDEGAPPVTVCQSCARAAERELEAEADGPKLIGAVLLGLGAAVISSLVWYGIVVITQLQLGIIAVGVGWLVSQAVVVGAGGKRGTPLQVISVVIVLTAMAISEYLIMHHFAAQRLIQEGYSGIPLLLPASLTLQLIVEGIKTEPLTLLFWGIAAFEAFVIPARHRLWQAQ